MMAQSPVDLSLDRIQLFCQRCQVRELALFGSVLRDDFRADSDLVFLIEFEPEAQVGFVRLSKMRREELCPVATIEAAHVINRFIGDRDFEAFVGDDLLQSAVLHKLTRIDACARVPEH